MTKKVNDNNKLAIQMLIAMIGGILVGLLFMAARERLGADSTACGSAHDRKTPPAPRAYAAAGCGRVDHCRIGSGVPISAG